MPETSILLFEGSQNLHEEADREGAVMAQAFVVLHR